MDKVLRLRNTCLRGVKYTSFFGKHKNKNAPNLIRKRTVILLCFILLLYFTVDGGWSSWSDWKSCSKSCGSGIQERSRSCTRPAPNYGGKSCDGEARESRWCNTHSCPGKVRVGESLRFFRFHSKELDFCRKLVLFVYFCKLFAVAVRIEKICNQFLSLCSQINRFVPFGGVQYVLLWVYY